MVYVPSLSGVLLFGGYTVADQEAGDTWCFANGVWTEEAPTTVPPVRDSVGLALDGTGVTPILVSGDNLTQMFNDTWAYEYAPTVGPTVNHSTVEVSQSVSFTAYVSGGTAPCSAAFALGDGTDAFVSGPGPTISLPPAFTHPGTFHATVNVTDAVGAQGSFPSVLVTVTAGPAIAANAVPPVGDVGIPFSFNSSLLSPSTPPLTYDWEFGDGTNGSGASPTHAYAAAGVFEVNVTATDADFGVASTSLCITVVPDPTGTMAVAPTSPGPGVTSTFFANVTGGTSPYTFAWRFGDGPSSAFPAPQHAFTGAGTYSVQVWANDSDRASAHGTLSVTVSGSSSTPRLFGIPLWFLAAIGVLVAVGVVGTALLLRRGRI